MSLIKCSEKKCHFFKECNQKNDPYRHNKICPGYKAYVNQDNIPQKGYQFEIPFTDINITEQNISSDIPSPFDFSTDTYTRIVQLFFFNRLQPKEISKLLNCSQQRVYKVVKECRNFLLEKERKKPGRKKKDVGIV